jgi:hypothetical protein
MNAPRLVRGWLLVILAGLALGGSGCSVMYVMTGQGKASWPPPNVMHRTPIYHQGNWTVARGSMHNHTNVSDGAWTLEQLVELARMEGIAVLADTDHREGDIRVGKAVKIPINGIERNGYDAYFEHLNQVKAATKDIILIGGAEVIPYFYNVGRPPNFVVFNENHHFTVYGVSDPQVFKDMPARRGMKGWRPEPLIGLEPYQTFVDYIVDHGGIVHGVHLESEQDMWIAGIAHFIDRKHPEFVFQLKRLTGFSVTPEAYAYSGAAGSEWDAAALEYLLGSRAVMPWALGDADYHGPDGSLTNGTTMFYLREFSEAEVMAALREGRMVALMGDKLQDSYVAEFSVAAEGASPADPIMFGQKTTVAGPARIRFRLDHEVPGMRSELIRNGKTVLSADACALEFIDREAWENNLPAAYRVRVIDPNWQPYTGKDAWEHPPSQLFTNPIFVYPARAGK